MPILIHRPTGLQVGEAREGRSRNMIGQLVHWREEDGTVVVGSITSEEVKYNANLDMDLTHVVINWSDGQEPTQHTLESLAKDPRVKLQS
jgi:flagellar hook assembly protein FlgD